MSVMEKKTQVNTVVVSHNSLSFSDYILIGIIHCSLFKVFRNSYESTGKKLCQLVLCFLPFPPCRYLYFYQKDLLRLAKMGKKYASSLTSPRTKVLSIILMLSTITISVEYAFAKYSFITYQSINFQHLYTIPAFAVHLYASAFRDLNSSSKDATESFSCLFLSSCYNVKFSEDFT